MWTSIWGTHPAHFRCWILDNEHQMLTIPVSQKNSEFVVVATFSEHKHVSHSVYEVLTTQLVTIICHERSQGCCLWAEYCCWNLDSKLEYERFVRNNYYNYNITFWKNVSVRSAGCFRNTSFMAVVLVPSIPCNLDFRKRYIYYV